MSNVFGELGPGNERSGYASRELRVGPGLGEGLWGGTVYELAPGERICPYHWHVGEEEWLVVVSGTPTLRTPDGEKVLAPWDATVFARGPGGAHEVRNETDASARVLMLSSFSDPEICVYPDSGKISAHGGWTRPDTAGRVLIRNRTEANLDYYEGEA